jgi:hypothetical protein
MKNDELRVTNDELQVTNDELLVKSGGSAVTDTLGELVTSY